MFLAFAPLGHGMRPGPLEGSGHYGNRLAGWKDSGAGPAGMGGATRHGFPDHAQKCGSSTREFQHLRSSGKRT